MVVHAIAASLIDVIRKIRSRRVLCRAASHVVWNGSRLIGPINDTKLDSEEKFSYCDGRSREDLMAAPEAAALAASLQSPPRDAPAPDVAQLLFGATEPPPFPDKNIFPLEWRTETPKLRDIYESGRDPGWSPAGLPWHTL